MNAIMVCLEERNPPLKDPMMKILAYIRIIIHLVGLVVRNQQLNTKCQCTTVRNIILLLMYRRTQTQCIKIMYSNMISIITISQMIFMRV